MDELLTNEYELGYLVTEKEAGEIIVSVLEKHGAQIRTKSEPISRELAYTIKKHTAAFFGYCIFSADRNVLLQIEAGLKAIPALIRHIIITVPPKSEVLKERSIKPRGEAPKRSDVNEQPLVHTLSNEDLEQKLEEILK